MWNNFITFATKTAAEIDFEDLFPVVLLSVSSSLDNLSVGLAHGMAGRKISHCVNAWISLFNSVAMALCAGFGEELGDFLPARLPSLFSGLIFIALGIYTMNSEVDGGEIPRERESDNEEDIEMKSFVKTKESSSEHSK